ncbi:hypothetical protein GCM10010095_20570 [Streptomyces anthocyanicus]|nr:hypothetical protein GCM10010095_20570 [Streptomyces anthocyanicus]
MKCIHGLAVQWIRSNLREARRVDRQIDRGGAGGPLAACNAYLAALRARARRPAPAVPEPQGARSSTPKFGPADAPCEES